MDFKHPTTIEEAVLGTLAGNAATGVQLLESARSIKKTLTKQALYVVLRHLLAQEVIVKHGTQYSLSNIWLGKMAEFFARAHERYGVRREGVDFLNLQEGDKISYAFKSPHEADRFWGHAFDVLSDTTKDAIYIYNPHEWFILARQESELHLFNKLKDRKRHLWLTVGNKDPLDVYAKHFFDGTYLQYHMLDNPLFEKRNYYLNIFGDFIIEAFIDPETAQKVGAFYARVEAFDDTVIPNLQALVSQGRTKLTISRNTKKAAKLKKTLGQYFFVEQESD
jgi:hypothetical protein